MIDARLAEAVRRAAERAQTAGDLPAFPIPEVELERPARKEHGDWASGLAMAAAKEARMAPRQIADAIIRHLEPLDFVAKVEPAGAGFINFFLTHAWLTGIIREVEEADESWGRSAPDPSERIQVEFVSANPTGPMHVGNARWAAVGDSLASVLQATGHEVEREFYINDWGTQVDLFARSLDARYRELDGGPVEMPEGGYFGSYMKELARDIAAEHTDKLKSMPDDERVASLKEEGLRRMIERMRSTLERFGVRYDVWFSERTLHEGFAVAGAVERLAKLGMIAERDGAVWLLTTRFGDDKDRVLIRANGEPTYFASDIAYWLDKRARAFDRVIYLWGADHHGHVPRMKMAIEALGDDPTSSEFIIGQLVNLLRGGEPVRMSKRTGEIVTFEELLDEVGRDAARYTFLRQGIDTPMDFDIELVVRQTQENPVYYVQYAHARICSILHYAEEQGIVLAPADEVTLEELQHESELDLIRKIEELPDAVAVAARLRAPNRLTRYAEDLASLFHAFYRDCRVVSNDPGLTQARLHLSKAARITLRNVLTLLGVSAPERM